MGNDSGKFVFIQMHNDRQNELKVSGELSWPELAEEFFAFLQGSGYVLTREDFADYWSQYLEDAKYDADSEGCGGGCGGCGHDAFQYMADDLSTGSDTNEIRWRD